MTKWGLKANISSNLIRYQTNQSLQSEIYYVVDIFFNLSMCLPISLLACRFDSFSIILSPFLVLSVPLSLYISISLSLYLSFFPTFYLSLSPSFTLYLYPSPTSIRVVYLLWSLRCRWTCKAGPSSGNVLYYLRPHVGASTHHAHLPIQI